MATTYDTGAESPRLLTFKVDPSSGALQQSSQLGTLPDVSHAVAFHPTKASVYKAVSDTGTSQNGVTAFSLDSETGVPTLVPLTPPTVSAGVGAPGRVARSCT